MKKNQERNHRPDDLDRRVLMKLMRLVPDRLRCLKIENITPNTAMNGASPENERVEVEHPRDRRDWGL